MSSFFLSNIEADQLASRSNLPEFYIKKPETDFLVQRKVFKDDIQNF